MFHLFNMKSVLVDFCKMHDLPYWFVRPIVYSKIKNKKILTTPSSEFNMAAPIKMDRNRCITPFISRFVCFQCHYEVVYYCATSNCTCFVLLCENGRVLLVICRCGVTMLTNNVCISFLRLQMKCCQLVCDVIIRFESRI